jgi:uncharacterized protein YecE (DUF72 family)
MGKEGKVRIGISGWTYAPWRGVFYPKSLIQKRELAFAADRFRSIEINGTFYGLQRPDSFARWAAATPEDFVFAVKAPRFITHMRRLKEIEAPMANFIASGLLRLGPKLGPILWQFPPNFAFDAALFESFLALLPHDTEQAVALGRRHDARMNGRSWLDVEAGHRIRHAVEIRHDSFRVPAFIELLRRHRTGLVCADTVEWPRLMDLTADFIYCRLHGSEQLYASGYDDEAIDAWARRVRAWAAGSEPKDAERVLGPAPKRQSRDVYVYFDNDMKVRAPVDAAALIERVSAAARPA